MHRFYALSAHTRQRFGEKVQKIPLDAGFTCPNRDGTVSHKGCVFCNPKGSGSGFRDQGLSIADQWAFWRDIHVKKHKLTKFSAYFQSFSNTHGPLSKLADTLDSVAGLPGLAALNIGTRPDCLDADKLDLLASRKHALGLGDVTLELGLQSANNATLDRINRGHDAEAFARAALQAADRGLTVVAHVMAGLPTPDGREGLAEMLDTVRFLNGLPVHGIKFHNLFVCRRTPLALDFTRGVYTPLTLDEYLHILSHALMHLDPAMVIHRLNGNPSQGELIAPAWAGNMRKLHNDIRAHLDANDIWQGKFHGAESAPPQWFSPHYTGAPPLRTITN